MKRLAVALALVTIGCGAAPKCPDPPPALPVQSTVEAPAPPAPNRAPPGVFHIEVSKNGALSIEGSPIDGPSELGERARISAKERPDLLVIVAAEMDTPFGTVLNAYRIAKNAGFQSVTIAEPRGKVASPATATPQQSVPQLVNGDAFKCAIDRRIENLQAKSAFIAIHVGPDGVAQTVDILEDPGDGLGEAARTCALAQQYRPALDASGKPTTGTKKLRLFFQQR